MDCPFLFFWFVNVSYYHFITISGQSILFHHFLHSLARIGALEYEESLFYDSQPTLHHYLSQTSTFVCKNTVCTLDRKNLKLAVSAYLLLLQICLLYEIGADTASLLLLQTDFMYKLFTLARSTGEPPMWSGRQTVNLVYARATRKASRLIWVVIFVASNDI